MPRASACYQCIRLDWRMAVCAVEEEVKMRKSLRSRGQSDGGVAGERQPALGSAAGPSRAGWAHVRLCCSRRGERASEAGNASGQL